MNTEPALPGIHRVADEPRIFTADGFIDAGEIAHVLAKADRIENGPTTEIAVKRNVSGVSFPMAVTGDEVLERVAGRIHAVLGFGNDLESTFRFRRYGVGNSHPPHLDAYEMENCLRVASALVYLNDAESGGETDFPEARPGPVRIAPRRGRLAVWFNYRADGSPEPAALHASLAVERGEKATIAYFVYREKGGDAG